MNLAGPGHIDKLFKLYVMIAKLRKELEEADASDHKTRSALKDECNALKEKINALKGLNFGESHLNAIPPNQSSHIYPRLVSYSGLLSSFLHSILQGYTSYIGLSWFLLNL